MTPLERVIDYIMRFTGCWYTWGGDDPSGFDCSGLVVEYLKAIGLMDRRKDLTAQGLWDKLIDDLTDRPSPGGLVFYRRKSEHVPEPPICHVEIVIDEQSQLGASGGGSHVTSFEAAAKANAYVKMRPIGSNRGLKVAGYVRLFENNGHLINEGGM